MPPDQLIRVASNDRPSVTEPVQTNERPSIVLQPRKYARCSSFKVSNQAFHGILEVFMIGKLQAMVPRWYAMPVRQGTIVVPVTSEKEYVANSREHKADQTFPNTT